MAEGTTTITRPGAGKGGALRGLTRNKPLLYAGGAAVGAVAVYAWWTRGQDGAAEAESELFDAFGNPIAGPTPGLTEPTVLDSNVTVPGLGPRTNAEWTQAATDYLEGRGYQASVVLGSIAKFLQRRPLTTVEAEMVGAAVASQGWPPEDRPWTIIPATATTPAPTPTPTPTPTGLAAPAPVRGTATRTSIYWTWTRPRGTERFYYSRVGGGSGTTRLAYHRSTGLRPNTSYTFRVRAARGTRPNEVVSPPASVTIRTRR